jgi:hypothetical protein
MSEGVFNALSERDFRQKLNLRLLNLTWRRMVGISPFGLDFDRTNAKAKG